MDKTCKSNGIFQIVIFEMFSGERVRNTWITFREAGDSPGKRELIPDVIAGGHPLALKVGDRKA